MNYNTASQWVMKAKTSPKPTVLYKFTLLIITAICLWEGKTSVNQLLSKDNNIFLRKWKVWLTHIDQYLSGDAETLNGTKITEALGRAFQTLKNKKTKIERTLILLQNHNMTEPTKIEITILKIEIFLL